MALGYSPRRDDVATLETMNYADIPRGANTTQAPKKVSTPVPFTVSEPISGNLYEEGYSKVDTASPRNIRGGSAW